MYIIKGILITEDGLIFENTLVNNEEKLTLVKQRVKEVYQEQEEWFLTNIEQKNASQVERSRKRKQREQEEKLALQEKITPGKYNVFHWPEKLDV